MAWKTTVVNSQYNLHGLATVTPYIHVATVSEV